MIKHITQSELSKLVRAVVQIIWWGYDSVLSYKAITRLPIPEYDERRQRFNFVLVSNARVLLCIDFDHLDFIF